MIGRIQRAIARSVPVTSAVVEEGQSRCWRGLGGGAPLKVGMMEDGGEADDQAGALVEAGKHVALDVGGAPFMHAFIIPNYKVWPLSLCPGNRAFGTQGFKACCNLC